VATKTENLTLSAGTFGGSGITCPSGKIMGGGGWSSNSFFLLIGSYPLGDSGWGVIYRNTGSTEMAADITVYAICAQVAE